MAGHRRRARRKLSNLVLSEVSLVDDGDNPGARFVLFKRRDDKPTADEQELFGKAFHLPGQATSAADCPPGWRFVASRQVCVREARLSKQPTVSDVHVPSTGRDDNERRRRRPRRGRGVDDGSGHIAKLQATLREQATGGVSPHEHELELPDGPLAAGTFRSSRVQDHAHDVQLPDLQPGQTATVTSGAAIPSPPEGVGPHTHSVRVAAVEVVSSRRELEKQPTKREADQDFPARAFASVPDRESPSTWKLRLFDRVADVGANRPSIVQTAQAAVALGPSGFRGNRVQLPSGTREAVIRRVRAAWLRARRDRDVTRDDLPAVLKLKGRVEMFDRMVEAITKWAGRAPDSELRKRLFDEVRQDSQREHVVGVLMGRMGDLAVSIREILFDPEGEAGDAERLVKQSLTQFADGIDGELSQIFAGQIVKALADREDPPDHDEVETALEKIFTDSSADPADDDEEEGMDLSKLSKEERETLETALDGAGSVEDFLAAAGKIAELEAQATVQTNEIAKLRRAVTGEPEPPEDPLEGLDPELRKRIEPQLRAANEAATKATSENVELRKRLDKIEAVTARSTFEKSVGDLTGLPQKREELVDLLWKVSDPTDRAKMAKNLEAAATAARTGIFTEVGSGLSEGGTAYAQIEAAAEEIRKANPGMTEAVSKAKAMELHPDLYDAYLEEDGGAIN